LCTAISDPRRNPRVSSDLRQDRLGGALPVFRQDRHHAVVLTNRISTSTLARWN
jgi:hypothetical protein